MTNNDILRRLRFILNYNDKKMIAVMATTGEQTEEATMASWLKKEDEDGFIECNDQSLAIFLNGLIIDKRGRRDGPQPEPEKRLNNNLIMMKLKIAFSLESDSMIEIIELTDYKISKHELTAFFRKKDHKHYRVCHDQFLRKFLKGMQLKFCQPCDSTSSYKKEMSKKNDEGSRPSKHKSFYKKPDPNKPKTPLKKYVNPKFADNNTESEKPAKKDKKSSNWPFKN